MLRIAIVGLGPWGVCTLERVVTRARRGLRSGLELEVHIVEPATPGSGVYDVTQPDYLVLNNPCGQLSLYPYASEADQPPYGLGLYEWAVAEGYGWVGERCVRDPAARPVERHDFLPRRLMGEYLQWFHRALVAAAPPAVQIVHHQAAAVDLIARADGTELVCLDNGEWLLVEHVIVTSGHTANEEHAEVVPYQRQLSPYPVTRYADRLPDGLTVGVSGMGLVAVDVVTALTIGRGGRYVEDGEQRFRYEPSGHEPKMMLFSRSGLPFTAKSVSGVDRTGVYRPVICTPAALEALTAGQDGGRRRVDVRRELLPVLFAEMCARYYAQVAFQAGSLPAGAAVRERLRDAWQRDEFDAELTRLAGSFGAFDPAGLFFGPDLKMSRSDDYARAVYEMLADDLREAQVPGGASPVKSASEVFRIFRDPMRSVVEQGGLSLESYLDFNEDIYSRIKRLVAGPPALRSQQVLALMDAGLVSAPFGPAPALGPGEGAAPDLGGLIDGVPAAGGAAPAPIRISSSLLGESLSAEVDLVIRGHLEEPRIDGSASMLLSRLYDEGRISQFRYGSVTVGSVDLTPDSHPIDINGRVQERIWMFGVLTEGVRHFTHYIPSPKSRIRAFEDIGACVDVIVG